MSDIDTAVVVDGLKALDPKWPIREAGMDVFFVLSGFIMVAVAGRETGPMQFLWRRASRIYPTYWMVSLAVLAVAIAAPAMVNSSVTVRSRCGDHFCWSPMRHCRYLPSAGRLFTRCIFLWCLQYFWRYAFGFSPALSDGACFCL